MVAMLRALLNHEIGIPLFVEPALTLRVGAQRFFPFVRAGAQPRPSDEDNRAHQHHRDTEMLRADLIQDECRKQKNRQHEIQQDDLESGHGCTFAAGEQGFSVAPEARACAEA